ncbi:MAG: CRISPR-associated endonuclease Cas2 [Candidatus Hodarchaeota archaeon]
MIYWILYDISNSNQRNRIIQILKDYGLERRQKSAFIGDLLLANRKNLEEELKQVFKSDKSKKNDSLFIIPVCTSCFQKTCTLGTDILSKEDFVSKTIII